MKTNAPLWALMAALGIPCRALAVDATTLFSLYKSDGDALVEPGEVAEIHVLVDLEPGAGGIDPETGYPVWGFAGVGHDFLAGPGWFGGAVTWDWNREVMIPELPTYDPKTGSLIGGRVVQFATGPFSPADPIYTVKVTWDPLGHYSPRSVSVTADAQAWPGGAFDDTCVVYLGDDAFATELAIAPLAPATFTFQVVPAPGAAVFHGLIAPALLRRRRRVPR